LKNGEHALIAFFCFNKLARLHHSTLNFAHPASSQTESDVKLNISPPVAVEDLLLKEGAVGAEERGWEHAASVRVQQADVVGLALELRVGIVT
jgi:hypothetical protein